MSLYQDYKFLQENEDSDKMFVLPQSGYDEIKRNMYYGPIYKKVDRILYGQNHGLVLVSWTSDDIKKAISDILGDCNHPIGKKALQYIYNYVKNQIKGPGFEKYRSLCVSLSEVLELDDFATVYDDTFEDI